MAFKLKGAVALRECSDQVQEIICMPRHRNTVWTAESLHQHLDRLGLDYTLEEVERINGELHKRGVVEDV